MMNDTFVRFDRFFCLIKFTKYLFRLVITLEFVYSVSESSLCFCNSLCSCFFIFFSVSFIFLYDKYGMILPLNTALLVFQRSVVEVFGESIISRAT